MKSPESVIVRLFGDIREAEILGRTIDVQEAVSIPADEDIDHLLADHAERRALWSRVVSKAKRELDTAVDALEEIKSARFHQYWTLLEERERAEMEHTLVDEDEARDPWRRKTAIQARVSQGVKRPTRWRRNFSDDLVWSMVHTDDEVVRQKKIIRRLRAQVEIAFGLRDALDHRARCLSHLAAHHRDATRA